MMNGDSRAAEAGDRFMLKVRDTIEEYGWVGSHIFDPDGAEPPFTYTTGRDPELIVLGLEPNQAHMVLGAVLGLGIPLTAGQIVEGAIEGGYRLRLDEVPPADIDRLLTVSKRWRGGEPFQALQVMWPDPKGVLPGEDGCDEGYADAQRLENVT